MEEKIKRGPDDFISAIPQKRAYLDGGLFRLDGETILVTGAGGFLGSHLCPALAASGANVQALVRGDSVQMLSGVWRVFPGELDNRDRLREALRGATAVVHLAGRAHLPSESSNRARSELHRVNVEGTGSLIAEVLRSDVRHFVHVSSVGAVSGGSDGAISEATPARPVTAYGMSKLAADQIVSERCSQAGISYAILRPPMIYGPCMKGNPLQLFRLVHGGVPLPVAGIRNQRTLLYVGNFVEAVKALLSAQPLRSGHYLVGDRESVSTPDLVRAIARALNVRPRLVTLPECFLRWGGRLGDAFKGRAFLPTTRQIEQLFSSLVVDSSLLMRTTGFRQPFSIAEGMEITADWYLAARR